MKPFPLIALSLVSSVACAQNLPVWWSGSTATNDASDRTVATILDASTNSYQLAKVAAGIKITKFDAQGHLLWTHPYGGSGDVANALALDSTGNPVFVGSHFDAGTAKTQLLLVKLSKTDGSLTWSHTFAPLAGGTNFIGYDLKLASDDSIVVGASDEDGAGAHPILAKYASGGAFALWTKNYSSYVGRVTSVDVNGSNAFFGWEATSPLLIGAIGRAALADGNDVTQAVRYAPPAYSRLSKVVAISPDTLLFAGFIADDYAGSTNAIGYYGSYNFATTQNAAYTTSQSGLFPVDVAYDAVTGSIAFQDAGAGSLTYVVFGHIDSGTGALAFTNSSRMAGLPNGIVSVGDDRFASLSQDGSNLRANLVQPDGTLLTSYLVGPATVDRLADGVLLGHPNVAGNGRAVTAGGGSAVGAKIYGLSYLAGPNDDRRIREDTPITFNVLTNDGGVGTTKESYIDTNPSHGSATLQPDGTVTYTPNPNFYGTDTFTYYVVVDGTAAAHPTVTITVLPVPDAPTAVDDNEGNLSWSHNTPLVVLDNDINPDAPDDALRIVSFTQPSNATVTVSADRKILTIRPNARVTGPFSFTYTITNKSGVESTATVTGAFSKSF